MYNPFPLLTPGLLKDQLTKGKTYFVRQSFPRGMDSAARATVGTTTAASTFLIRAYAADEKPIAEQHMARLNGAPNPDPHAFLYEAASAEHLRRLAAAAQQPKGYKVFYAAKKGIDWKPPPKIQDQIKEHIRLHHPAWRTKRGSSKIQAGLYEELGELFIKFSFEDEEEILLFDLIEKY